MTASEEQQVAIAQRMRLLMHHATAIHKCAVETAFISDEKLRIIIRAVVCDAAVHATDHVALCAAAVEHDFSIAATAQAHRLTAARARFDGKLAGTQFG